MSFGSNKVYELPGVSNLQLMSVPEFSNYSLIDMPQDFIKEVMLRLGAENISAVSLACRSLYQTTRSEDLWRRLYNRDFQPLHPFQDLFKEFSNTYKGCYTLQSNLAKGVYALSALAGHTEPGGYGPPRIKSLVIADGKLFSCCEYMIRTWDLENRNCLSIFQGSTSEICSLAFANGKLFFGSYSGEIKFWNMVTGGCINTLGGHAGRITCLIAADGKLFSSSYDNTIKIWDVETEKCLNTLNGHTSAVRSLAVGDGKLFSSSYGHKIRIWDIKTGSYLNSLKGHTQGILSLAYANGMLFSGADDHTIKIWDIKTGACLNTLVGHTNSVCSLIFASGNLISDSFDDTMKIWNIETGSFLNLGYSTGRGDTSYAFDNGKLFLGCKDKTIKIWDFNANHSVIFAELAELFKHPDPYWNWVAMERFSRMPKNARAKVYGELYHLLKPFANEYWGCAEHAFHDQYGQGSTKEQKAQAIENYLKLEHGKV